VSPRLCFFLPPEIFLLPVATRICGSSKATSQFSWFVSSAPERAKVMIWIFFLRRFSVQAELPLAQTGARTQFLSAEIYVFGNASAFLFLV
jgi:hypothetical protein